ncbi:MAG: hypothetical protein SGPRY_013317 [Prymnesium sp.]
MSKRKAHWPHPQMTVDAPQKAVDRSLRQKTTACVTPSGTTYNAEACCHATDTGSHQSAAPVHTPDAIAGTSEAISPSLDIISSTSHEIAHLLHNGYLLVRIDPALHHTHHKLFVEYLENIPEMPGFKIGEDDDVGAGSFGAINFASAYHCPAATRMDMDLTSALRGILKSLGLELRKSFLQCLPDRLFYRTKAQNAESYHRDNTYGASPTDSVLGSIYNLNHDVNQSFVCVPGEFSQISGPLVEKYKEAEVDITIPPSHVLLFFENIVHRVTGRKPCKPLFRKATGFMLSKWPRRWCPENKALVDEQGALHFKGGLIAPLYPKLWKVNWPMKAAAYCSRLIPELRSVHTYNSGKRKGQTFDFPLEYPPNLTSLGKRYRMDESSLSRFEPLAI